MILVEVGEPSLRRTTFDQDQNVVEIRGDLDLIDEVRDLARVKGEACKLRAARRYNSMVRPRKFKVGDLVWRATGEARKDKAAGKLTPNWEGPFRIAEDLENGVYRLEELSGRVFTRTWNATHLKFYYS